MSNSITNRFTLIGNDATKALAININTIFQKEHMKKNGDTMKMTGKLFLSMKNHGEHISAFTECTEVYYQNDTLWMPTQTFTLITVNGKAYKLQDLILMKTLDLDEKAIICCDYYDEYGMFYGTRYVLLSDNQIKEYLIEKDCKGFSFETEKDTAKFESAMHKNKLATFNLMKKEHKWIKNDKFIKLKS